jgi:hypothetical protein
MKDDDLKSRHARATLHLNDERLAVSDEVLAELRAFIAQDAKGLRYVEIPDLLKGSDFERLYRAFRDMSPTQATSV